MHRTETLPFHSNGMRFTAYDDQGGPVHTRVYYSVGGGFVVDESASEGDVIVDDPTPVRYPFSSAEELLAQCREYGLSISSLMLANEQAWRTEAEVRERAAGAVGGDGSLYRPRAAAPKGIMPGGLKVKRRAAQLYRQLKSSGRLPWRRVAEHHGLGDALRLGRERGERGRWADCDGAHQWGGGNYSSCAQVLPAPLPWRERRGRLPLFIDCRRYWHPL